MNACLRGVGVLCLGLFALALAGSSWTAAADKDTTKPVVAARTLRLPDTPYRYTDLDLPAHFRAARRADNTPRDNPITDAGATLGRVLFYDTRMSANNTTACASCHHQKFAFTDGGNRFSKGFEGKFTDRNAMSLVNLRYYPRGRFFWDERARTLEDQVLMPIQSKIEMGHDLTKLVEILAKDEHYPELFKKAFGDNKITKERMARALAQFLRSMVSYQSKYDEGLAKAQSVRDDFENFTAQENRGKAVFLGRCATCHMRGGEQSNFFMDRPLNNGLDADIKNSDGGVGDLTFNRGEMGLFKSPSLRNVELTAPYMHDGRLATLEAVVDHYRKDAKAHPNVDRRVFRSRNMSDRDKSALIAFLKTLTDHKFLTDPRYSDPFVPVTSVSQTSRE